MRPLCIYHSSCTDGFGSALIVHNHFKGDVDIWRGRYQSEKLPSTKDRDVYIVDFSYKPSDMYKLQMMSKKIIWLDHHVSAIEAMNDFQWRGQDVNGSSLDPMKSGVGLTWNHFYPEDPMPALYENIQDWDTWQFKLHNTRKVHYALHSHEQDFTIWNKFLDDEGYRQLVVDGVALERNHNLKVVALVRQAFMMSIAGYQVPVVNASPDMASDVGNELSKGQPFAGIWFETEKSMSFSLRSQEDGQDVSKIAAMFGGGGHKRSAGFQILKGRAPIEVRK